MSEGELIGGNSDECVTGVADLYNPEASWSMHFFQTDPETGLTLRNSGTEIDTQAVSIANEVLARARACLAPTR